MGSRMARWKHVGKCIMAVLIFSSIGFNGFLLFRDSIGPVNSSVNQQDLSGDERKGFTRLEEGHPIHVEGTTVSSSELVKSAPVAKGSRQVLRRKTLLQACSDLEFEEHPSRDHNLTLDEVNSLKYTYILDKHKLLFCYVPKVSCTSWKYLFLVSYGVFPPHAVKRRRGERKRSVHIEFGNVFKMVGQLDEVEANQKLKDYTNFLFVRNPFSRMLSAYREKIEGKNPDDPVKGFYSRFITRWFKKTDPLYLEQRNKTTPYSFRDFVRYFMARRVEDAHWNDQYQLCHPCLVEYDYIGKYETLYEDAQDFLGSVVNGSSLIFPTADPVKPTWNSSSNHNMATYYRTIPDDDFISLVDCLYPDLRLFGYSIPKAIRRPGLQLSRQQKRLIDVG